MDKTGHSPNAMQPVGHRHAFRAQWHDYNSGVYFITICAKDHKCHFGKIVDKEMILSPVGEIAERQIAELSAHFANVQIWNYVVMPNHVHMVIYLNHGPVRPMENTGNLHPSKDGSFKGTCHHNSGLSVIIRSLKGGIAREARKIMSRFAWQPRFHDHIIREQRRYEMIMNYIDTNVSRWGEDCFNLDDD